MVNSILEPGDELEVFSAGINQNIKVKVKSVEGNWAYLDSVITISTVRGKTYNISRILSKVSKGRVARLFQGKDELPHIRFIYTKLKEVKI